MLFKIICCSIFMHFSLRQISSVVICALKALVVTENLFQIFKYIRRLFVRNISFFPHLFSLLFISYTSLVVVIVLQLSDSVKHYHKTWSFV